MKKKTKPSNLDLYNNRHHVIHIKKNSGNMQDDYLNENNTNLNGNSLKILDAIGSSYLITDKKRNIKEKSFLQKIKNNTEKKREKYFDVKIKNTYKFNFSSINENNPINKINNIDNMNNKIIHTQKKKKLFLKDISDDDDEIINCDYFKINSEKRPKNKKEKIIQNKKRNKITYIGEDDKLKEILKNKFNKINNNTHENHKSNKKDENSLSNNEDIYIYNGCDNILIREQYNNNLLNINKNNENNFLSDKSNRYKKIYLNNINSMKNVLKNRKDDKYKGKVYQKKITKSPISFSKINDKNQYEYENRTFMNNNIIKNIKKIKLERFVPVILNEGNKKYFKINTDFINDSYNDLSEDISDLSKELKIYKKPNQSNLVNHMLYQNSSRILNNKTNSKTIDTDSSNFNEFDRSINEKKIKIKNIQFKKDDSIDLKSDTNKINSTISNILNTKEINDDDKLISFSSYAYQPQISINNIKINFPNYFQINAKDKTLDSEENNFKESYRINYKDKNNEEYYFKSYKNIFTHLPISEYNYFTKENKIIIKNIGFEKNIFKIKMKRKKCMLKTPKLNKNNISNNFVPIKPVKEKSIEKNLPFIISKNMFDKFNKKIEEKKFVDIPININKKTIRESISIDSKILSKSNDMNKSFSNNIILNKENNNNDKNKTYRIRSVVKFVKKSKSSINILELKEEKNKIKEEIKKNIEETKEERIKNDKIKKILKEEIENFISYYNNKNIENKKNFNYNVSIIEQLIIKIKVDLIDIINCFLKICNDIIDDNKKMKTSLEYIKLLIEFYNKNYLNEKNIKIIHVKILRILYNIEKIPINNKYKYEILGNIFYYFLIEKMFKENDLNKFDSENEYIIIDIAKVVRFIIVLFSKDIKIAKEIYKKFENLQLFKNKNHVYYNYVSNYLKTLLNI